MNTLLPTALIAVLFLICSRRPLTQEARSPSEMAELVRAYRWRFVLGVLWIAVVASLLVLVDVCRLAHAIARETGKVCAALAEHVEDVGSTRALESA